MTFGIRPFEAKTLSWWYDQRENIDFDPSYQRKGRLWSEKDKSYLIDSILNGFDLPKIYIADFTYSPAALNEHRKTFAVVDGKQRFEAMFDFMSGKLTLDKNFVYNPEPQLELAGLSFKDLKSRHPRIASNFENFNLSVFSIITDDESTINEMFIRLNKSKPLTGAELRGAMKGEVPIFTKKITSHHFFKDRVKFATQRMQDANVAAKFLLIEFRGKLVDTKKVHLDDLVDEFASSEVKSLQSAFNRVQVTLNFMDEAFITKDPLLGSSGILTIYYWFFKHFGESFSKSIRNFLVDFDRYRKQAKIRTAGLEDYVNFNSFTRSINDQSSLQNAYNILADQWTSWKNANNVLPDK
jgi:hypothetical protein